MSPVFPKDVADSGLWIEVLGQHHPGFTEQPNGQVCFEPLRVTQTIKINHLSHLVALRRGRIFRLEPLSVARHCT